VSDVAAWQETIVADPDALTMMHRENSPNPIRNSSIAFPENLLSGCDAACEIFSPIIAM
jgi:hypothetical protein